MQIPLDYYRILGVPTQATAEQLQQAYRDRLQQLPRHHYSVAAIAARKKLLELAYTGLSDPEQRQAYDATLLVKTDAPLAKADAPESQTAEGGSGNPTEVTSEANSEVTPTDPSPVTATRAKTKGIEIQDHLLTGALLLLQELGEYELVLQLGRPYLRSGILDLKHHRLGSVLSEADIVLTVALANLELGREQWQQGQYGKAARALQEGLELLLREGLFSNIQSEIRTDLHKLRPYQVLELLALPEDCSERRRGLSLLQDMLAERGGIDGTGNDQSGLSISEFLQFVQQLRSYLSVSEQQELFENEARRPSAVATYLAIYALVAQGYVQNQPALIRRANAMLLRLNTHQEVYLEQAMCALLLGQAVAANQILELSHEYESLAFIQQYSVDSPDLIPGLYLYTERWLQDEVFPYFRDLVAEKVHLKDYFADPQVQAYLDELETPVASVASPDETTSTPILVQPALQPSTASRTLADQEGLVLSSVSPKTRQHVAPEPFLSSSQRLTSQSQGVYGTTGTTTAVPAASGTSLSHPGTSRGLPKPALLKGKVANQPRVRKPAHRLNPRSVSRQQRWTRLGLMLLAVLALGTIVATIVYALRLQVPTPSEQPLVDLEQPPLPIPSSLARQDRQAPSSMALSQDGVKQLIQSWQSTKAAALGPKRMTGQLAQVLTGPALTKWGDRAQEDKANDWYCQYKLNRLSVEAVDSTHTNQVKAEVTINETANFFEQGQLQQNSSYTDTYRVRYTLVRQNGQWRIQQMQVL